MAKPGIEHANSRTQAETCYLLCYRGRPQGTRSLNSLYCYFPKICDSPCQEMIDLDQTAPTDLGILWNLHTIAKFIRQSTTIITHSSNSLTNVRNEIILEDTFIMLTNPCDLDSLLPHLYTVKLGYNMVYIIPYLSPKFETIGNNCLNDGF